jgi:hypothetical protein
MRNLSSVLYSNLLNILDGSHAYFWVKDAPGQKEQLRIEHMIYQIDRVLCELRIEGEENSSSSII